MTFDENKAYLECYFTFLNIYSSTQTHDIIRIRKRSRTLIRRILSNINVSLQYYYYLSKILYQILRFVHRSDLKLGHYIRVSLRLQYYYDLFRMNGAAKFSKQLLLIFEL